MQQSPLSLQFESQVDFPDQMNYHPRQTNSENIEKDYKDFLEWKSTDDIEYKEKVKNAPLHYDYVKNRIHD